LKNEEHGKEVDIFSFGVVLFELESQQRSWGNPRNMFEIRENINAGKPPGDLNLCPTFRTVIDLCLLLSPKSRPTFIDITMYLENNVHKISSAQMSNSNNQTSTPLSAEPTINKLLNGLVLSGDEVHFYKFFTRNRQ
jgi:hypothetical protein